MDYKKLIDIHIQELRLEMETVGFTAAGPNYYEGGISALEDLLAEIEEAECD